MENSYLSWGVYVAAVAAQVFYWSSSAPMAMTWKRLGRDPGLAGEWIWVVAISAVGALIWPVFALQAMSSYGDDSSMFSAILITLGSWLLGWLVSFMAKMVLGATMAGLDNAGAAGSLEGIATGATFAALVLGVGAYLTLMDFENL
jgi:hypothetical protein